MVGRATAEKGEHCFFRGALEAKVRKSGRIVRSALPGCPCVSVFAEELPSHTHLKGQEAASWRCLHPQSVFWNRAVAQDVAVCLGLLTFELRGAGGGDLELLELETVLTAYVFIHSSS